MNSVWLSLDLVVAFENYAKERGVSKVARGEVQSKVTDMGFMEAYKKVKGDIKKMRKFPVNKSNPEGQTWAERRNAFCKRHTAQMKINKRPSIETSGKFRGLPTRQETGLIMWACSNLSEKRLRDVVKSLN